MNTIEREVEKDLFRLEEKRNKGTPPLLTILYEIFKSGQNSLFRIIPKN